MEISERKNWLDNIRWITVVLVVFFHIFYFYNNIGTVPAFNKLAPNPAEEGGKAIITFAGIMQYSVYQWFMLLLFVVSGICAKITLQKKTVKQFLKARTQKLLVPSTLGVITIQWLSGWVISSQFLKGEEAEKIPGFVKYFISVASGTGALWFCHVLFVACLMLALIKVIDKNGRLEAAGEKSNIFVAAALYAVVLGAAQLLSVKSVSVYRMCYYPMGFLLGYYVISSEKLLAQLKKFGWIFLGAGIISGVFYIRKFYGILYSDLEVQNNWLSVFHAWFTVLGIIGAAQTVFAFSNRFSEYMTKASWGIYVNHLMIMIFFNALIKPVAQSMPCGLIYLLEFAVTLPLSILFWELFRRIPVLRYVLYGIRKPSKKEM